MQRGYLSGRLAWTLSGVVGLVCAPPSVPLAAESTPSQAVPVLANPPRMSGRPEAFAPALTLQPAPSERTGTPSHYVAKLAYRRSTLFLWVKVSDPSVTPGDVLNVAFFFPAAGATARPYTYRFGADGKRSPDPEKGPPSFANQRVEASVYRLAGGWSLLAAFPAQSLPRFPAKNPLIFELCITYEDRNDLAGAVDTVSNCKNGTATRPLRIPDEFRRSLKFKPPPDVDSLEGRENGWIGFARLHYPAWILSNVALTPETLRGFFSEEARDPGKTRIGLPSRMTLRGVGPLLSILTGTDPFTAEGHCNAQEELRIGLYLIKDNTARRVLEWPAATCLLGRALSVVLEDDGTLSIGYTIGTSVNFIWSTDHFERTEIG